MPKCDFCEIRGWSGKAYCLKKKDYVDNSVYNDYCNTYRFDRCPIFSNSSGGCYLTTACVEHMGLPDDCPELTALRAFRDGYLARQAGGREEIQSYYDTAPGIVEAIAKSGRAEAVYQRLYNEVILPCVTLIRDGENEAAHRKYREMVEALSAEFC